MNISDIDFYKDFFYGRAGLQIHDESSFLLDSRLTPIARKWGYTDLKAMTVALRALPKVALVDDVLDAVIAPETSMFCQGPLFDRFAEVLLLMTSIRRKGRLKIWSAGCAGGQEAYSLAMTLKRLLPPGFRSWSAEILATDVNSRAVARGMVGRYNQFEVQNGLPIDMLTGHFTPYEKQWQVNANIMSMVTFEPFNLLDNMRGLGPFDLILCRRVVKDFDPKTRYKVLSGLADCLTAKGLLVIDEQDCPCGLPGTLKPVSGLNWLYTTLDGPDTFA